VPVADALCRHRATKGSCGKTLGSTAKSGMLRELTRAQHCS
jgi:hypothetical protein